MTISYLQLNYVLCEGADRSIPFATAFLFLGMVPAKSQMLPKGPWLVVHVCDWCSPIGLTLRRAQALVLCPYHHHLEILSF